MRPRFRYLPHATRLAGFVLAGALVTSVVAVRQARAQVHEGMRHLARQLMPYAEQSVIEAPRRVLINGQALQLAAGTTNDSVAAALDYYEAQCERRGGHVTASLAAGNPGAFASAPFNQLWGSGGRAGARIETVREGDDREGYVACIDVGERRLTASELTDRLRAVAETGDLSRWGDLRYAYASRGTTGTRILTVATDGPFNFLRMFPAEGDAPGQDTAGLPRYPGTRRILSAREEGHPNELGIYTVRAPTAQVRDWYRGEMTRRGWALADLPRDRRLPPEVEASRDRSLAFARAGDATMVLVFDHADGLTSMMSLLAM